MKHIRNFFPKTGLEVKVVEQQPKFMLLNLPSPPGLDVFRGFAGGFGTAEKVKRDVYGHTGPVLLPSFLLYGASVLQRGGYEFSVVDAQALNYTLQKTIKEVEKARPDVLISWISLPSLHSDLNLLNEIKKSCPDMFITVLGTVCNVMTQEILSRDIVDTLIHGTYPYYNAILDFSKDIDNRPNRTKLPEESLEGLLLETYKLLPTHRYMWKSQTLDGSNLNLFPILIGIGCPYPCIHCPYPIGYGSKIIHKSIDLILSEIEFLKDNFGITDFDFRAQDFTQNKKFVFELCDGIEKKNLNIRWIIETRPDLVSKEILQKMKDAGCCRINFGVESGNHKFLDKLERRMSVETIREAFRMTRDVGMWTHAHLILGMPEESKETIQDTFDLLCELNPDSTSLNLMTPYPGTDFFELAEKEDWIATKDWSKYTSFDPVLNHVNAEELDRARKMMRHKFRLFRFLKNPSYRKRTIESRIKGLLHR